MRKTDKIIKRIKIIILSGIISLYQTGFFLYNRKAVVTFKPFLQNPQKGKKIMKKRTRHKSEIFRRTGICLILAMVLAAGCGNQNIQKDTPQQENTSAQQEDTQTDSRQTTDSQTPADRQTDNGQQKDSQTPADRQTDSGQQENSQTPADRQTAGQTAQSGNQAGTVNQPKLSPEEAREAALKHAGVTGEEATVIKEELDYDDGVTEYEIEFVAGGTKYEYEINAEDGAVLGSSQEPVEKLPENLQGQGIISVEEAKEAVLSHAGFTPEQVTYTKVDLEQDDGVTEYEIKFYADGKEYSGKVNASTGAILEYEMD